MAYVLIVESDNDYFEYEFFDDLSATTGEIPTTDLIAGDTYAVTVDFINGYIDSEVNHITAIKRTVSNKVLYTFEGDDGADLTFTITGKGLPSAIVVGTETKLSLAISITNVLNDSFDAGDSVNIDIIARETTTDAEVVIGSFFNKSISKLKPGKTKKHAIKVTLEASLPVGVYEIIGEMDNGIDALVTIFKSDPVALYTISIQDPFVDLDMDKSKVL
ncbi:MAG: hypothetical protein IIB41_03580, partial [Candidatus Marinimicrobia bacterium]|nr:hypothetical protein [Candidatus Neomarinimicrobiota bacterium]